nr:helix-turn-helix transcriptional regulator [uncultured Acetatifactor sp.]
MVTRKTPASLDAILSGQKIHGRILQSGYSIKEIQNMLGLECPQSVYRWLKGRSMPSIDNLYMLSQILDVHMEDLLVSMDAADHSV